MQQSLWSLLLGGGSTQNIGLMYVEVKGIAFRTMSFEVRMEGFSIQFAGEFVQLRGIIDCIILFSTSML